MSGAKREPSKRLHTLSIEFVGRSFRSANVLGPFVRVLTENPSLVPDRFAVEEDDWRPFDEQELVGFADGVSNYLLQISRQKRLKYEAYLRQFAFGGASIDVDAATPVKDWGGVFALGDRLAQAYQPQIGWVQTLFERACPLKGSTEMTLELIESFSDGLHFRDCGPADLGMRTYLGPRIVDLFGRDLLRATPALVRELPWGGMRIDLVEDPWTASDETLVGAWERATAHLAFGAAISGTRGSSDAELPNASFSGADLTDADLSGATFTVRTSRAPRSPACAGKRQARRRAVRSRRGRRREVVDPMKDFPRC